MSRRVGFKRLRDLAKPQYRLRVGDIWVFYDVVEARIEQARQELREGRGVRLEDIIDL